MTITSANITGQLVTLPLHIFNNPGLGTDYLNTGLQLLSYISQDKCQSNAFWSFTAVS